MAIYHFSGSMISRSQGRSVIASVAYRAAARLQDDYYGKVHDYTQKGEVVHSEILLPIGAPSWMKDRETLWNAVESGEKRKDAQLAREFTMALPRELTLEQNVALAREFVQETFVNQGMVADFCVHNHRMKNGERQPHVHVMLTLREVREDGFGQKVRSWNGKAHLLAWREAWAASVNYHLAYHGHDLRIDHRTLEAQGIDLEPQYKIGASVAKERLARLADHQRIARENGEKLLKHPEMVLEALTQQQSTFTHQDIARFVNRHTEEASQFEAVYAKVKGCSELVLLGLDSEGRERFTTKEMLALEQGIMNCAEGLSHRFGHSVGDSVNFSSLLANRSLTDEQRLAFDHLIGGGDLRCVVGYAGSGKSYLLGAAREVWELKGYRVLGATLSGIAAENLTGSSGIESRTLASRFYAWEKGEQLLTEKDVLVIDEAGMVGSRQMAKLLSYAEAGGAKVVLVGDPEQLQAISAGASFRAITERVGMVELTEIRRQRVDWQKAATCDLARGQTERALQRYDKENGFYRFETQAMAQKGLIERWNADRVGYPEESQIMLTYLRKEVQELNALARDCRRRQGELGIERLFKTERGDRCFAEQDRVYFLKNDRDLGVMNGTLGTIQAISGNQLCIRLDRDERQPPSVSREIWVDTHQYPHLDHGYAATIHKAQGVTVDRSYLLASTYLDRHATYVALSRHREQVAIFYSQEVFAQKADLFRSFCRERGKDVTLDYVKETQAFANVRGIASLVSETEGVVVHTASSRPDPEETLAAFKARYEKQHPEKASLHQAMVSRAEGSSAALSSQNTVSREEALDTLLVRYVEMSLEQSRLVTAMHNSTFEGNGEAKRQYAEQAKANDQALSALAREAMQRPDIQAIAQQRVSYPMPHLADLGGFEGIGGRLKAGYATEADRQVLTRHIRNKAQSESWSQDRSRDRGGRSR